MQKSVGCWSHCWLSCRGSLLWRYWMHTSSSYMKAMQPGDTAVALIASSLRPPLLVPMSINGRTGRKFSHATFSTFKSRPFATCSSSTYYSPPARHLFR